MPVDDDFLKSLPSDPGVYIMNDRKGRVLYVGKAGNLRNRVRNYFVKGGDDRPSVGFLVKRVDNIKIILTDTEKEALILENNLIKQHKPKYNVNLRDDKSFFSIKLNLSHPYPRLTLIRTQRIKPDRDRYFGPYSSARDARITLNFIQRLFPMRQCTDRQLSSCKRPCLNCQMKRCLCPCTGKVDPVDYSKMVKEVCLLLQGKADDLIQNLKSQMEEASRDFRFESAAGLRDRLASIERTLEAQNVSFFHLKDQDIIAVLSPETGVFVVQVLSFRKGNLLSSEHFLIKNPALDEDEILSSAIKQYYASGVFVPKEILISRPIEQLELIETWLSETRGGKVSVRVPLRGNGVMLIGLALKNAQEAVMRERQRENEEASAVQRIVSKFKLDSPPRVIEGYDISNISGTESFGVKVSFKDGKPDKAGYRKFRIRDFTDQDDPGMIHQTVSRRIAHAHDDPLPDIFLIDGGKAQLNAAMDALREISGENVPAVVSIAKARAQDEADHFYLPNRKNAVLFQKGDPGLNLLMRIRDEAHRFAHSAHTKSRNKAALRSVLLDIQGIGPKKSRDLLKAFGSVKAILSALDDDIRKVPGISSSDVELIRKHFHTGED
jgi:excinuclease ABC subunit C